MYGPFADYYERAGCYVAGNNTTSNSKYRRYTRTTESVPGGPKKNRCGINSFRLVSRELNVRRYTRNRGSL